jgi:hypothetical protein
MIYFDNCATREIGVLIMKNLTQRIARHVNAFLENKLILALRIIASLSGFAIRLWPGAENYILWIATVLSALAISTFVIQFALAVAHRFSEQIGHILLAHRYGFEYKQLDVRGVLKVDGSMELTRYVVLTTRSALTNITFYLRAFMPPDGSTGIIDFEKIDPPDIEMTAKPVENPSVGGATARVDFGPPLVPGDTAIYRTTERFAPGSFATTADRLASSRFEHEFLSWSVGRPTRHLLFRVSIPNSLDPVECRHDVWYGLEHELGSERHRAEWHRLEGCFSVIDPGLNYTVLQLEVDYPIVGLRYVLKWEYK